MTSVRMLSLLGVCLGLFACSSKSTTAATSTTTSPVEPSACSTDPRAELYEVGLSQTSMDGAVKVSFVDAEPAPPTKGNNTFTIALADKNGAPLDGATITTKPFMPDHGHGAAVDPTTTPMSNGLYEINPVTLFMPGIWQITFTVETPKGTPETVVFTFCVGG